MENINQNETTFYNQSGVVVTQSRFVTHSKTYAMRNISSVHIFEIEKSLVLPIILTVLGIVLLLADEARVAGGILLTLAILIFVLIKNKYAVRISTNSGEANSIVSKDKTYVQAIVNALNEAIIHRG